MQSINKWIHKTLSPTTYVCHVAFQDKLSSKFPVITILKTDSKSIAENRLLNRLKFKNHGPYLHMVLLLKIQICNGCIFYFPFTRTIAQTDRHTDRHKDGQS